MLCTCVKVTVTDNNGLSDQITDQVDPRGKRVGKIKLSPREEISANITEHKGKTFFFIRKTCGSDNVSNMDNDNVDNRYERI